MNLVLRMPKFLLRYFSGDGGACKIAIAAELSGVALSLFEISESGMI